MPQLAQAFSTVSRRTERNRNRELLSRHCPDLFHSAVTGSSARMKSIYVQGMHGLGDNLHQRAILRHLMQSHEVWLETPWPCIYHDLVGDRLKLVSKGSRLRTQAKNERRESSAYMRGKVPVLSKKIWYRPEAVRQHRSVLGAMCARSEEHTSELQSLMRISYAVFC